MAEVLTEEQLEELSAYLKGTDMSLAEGLSELGVRIRSAYHGRIEEALAEHEEIEQCSLCGQWTFSETMEYNDDDGDPICSDCVVNYDEEDW